MSGCLAGRLWLHEEEACMPQRRRSDEGDDDASETRVRGPEQTGLLQSSAEQMSSKW
eukprot:CAMPEP_0171568444 /NCGR_PEP_ID=MMETSP0961-20121227/1767_1 /TAXON_ID=87120 /ORGANISM="Aurantiochytrium limacinum, Strain ATCCMYA-1381" /LENGTH=56 /DNA_ID=CAMNT_0012122573 /DNA_START=427 /DNA_END=594 /DNA_ORIENTATION=-